MTSSSNRTRPPSPEPLPLPGGGRLLALAVAGMLASCAPSPGPAVGTTAPSADPPMEATTDPDARAPTGGTASAAATAAPEARGAILYQAVCATCHTLDPPPSTAPPMRRIVGHYLAFYGDTASARTALIEWVRNPAEERSALPPHAIERFGLMPPQGLSDEDLALVADYLLSVDGEPSRGHGPKHRRHRHRQGPGG